MSTADSPRPFKRSSPEQAEKERGEVAWLIQSGYLRPVSAQEQLAAERSTVDRSEDSDKTPSVPNP